VVVDAYLLHVLNGRLRIKVPEVKHAPQQAAEVVHALQSVCGVTSVHANPTTGSVLVFFEPHAVGPEQIVQKLQDMGCLTSTDDTKPTEGIWKDVGQKLAETLVQSIFERAVQHAIMVLI
jgi:copper chaperone CopZ